MNFNGTFEKLYAQKTDLVSKKTNWKAWSWKAEMLICWKAEMPNSWKAKKLMMEAKTPK